MILIVGAGLAGLSTAYHLSGLPYRLYEREQEVGGLCRSYKKDGFTFDYTGHLLHFAKRRSKPWWKSSWLGNFKNMPVNRSSTPTEPIQSIHFK